MTDHRLKAEPLHLGLRLQGVSTWVSASFAPKWFDDAMREAALAGPDARRREIVFAVCFAESYLLEWVRGEVLGSHALRRLDSYFSPKRQRSVTVKWKKVPRELHANGLISADPDSGQQEYWADFKKLVEYRDGLVHANASLPDRDALTRAPKPKPTRRDLEALAQGWPTRVVVSLVRGLHASVGPPPPWWLLDPDTVDPRGPKGGK